MMKRARYDARLELIPLDKLEIFIRSPRRRVFHLLCNVLEETSPPRCRAESGDVVCGHLDAFICGEEEAASWDVMDVIQIVCGSDGYEIRGGLRSGG